VPHRLVRSSRLASVVCLLGTACARPTLAPAPASHHSHACEDPDDVSLIRIIATPERFNGRCVRTIGYLHLEFEGDGLYVRREDYERMISKNGLWIDIDSDSLAPWPLVNDHYVLVEGIIDSKSQGHMGSWTATIGELVRLERWNRIYADSTGQIIVDTTGS
jgi:hypothetical protein